MSRLPGSEPAALAASVTCLSSCSGKGSYTPTGAKQNLTCLIAVTSCQSSEHAWCEQSASRRVTEGLSLLRWPHPLREYHCTVLMGFCGGASDAFPGLHQVLELVMAQAVQEYLEIEVQ